MFTHDGRQPLAIIQLTYIGDLKCLQVYYFKCSRFNLLSVIFLNFLGFVYIGLDNLEELLPSSPFSVSSSVYAFSAFLTSCHELWFKGRTVFKRKNIFVLKRNYLSLFLPIFLESVSNFLNLLLKKYFSLHWTAAGWSDISFEVIFCNLAQFSTPGHRLDKLIIK